MERLSTEDYIRGGTQKDFYEPHETEHIPCPLCGADEYEVLGADRGLKVVRCKHCELIYTNPRVKNAHENYHGAEEVYKSEARLVFKGKKPHHRDRNYEYELREIKKLKPKGRLLDVGPNMGFFARKAKEFGFEVEGVEPSPSLSKIARESWGLTIHNSLLEDANLPEKSFDIITLIDVLEHVVNPIEVLKSCTSILKDDGIIVVKVPNGDYNNFKQFLAKATGKESNIDIWDCYEHVIHYTPTTFKKLIVKCGYDLKKFIIPLPIHSPVWAKYVGHYYQYPSPFILDWKRITLRNIFYYIGKIERALGFRKLRFAPDLMFFISKGKGK